MNESIPVGYLSLVCFCAQCVFTCCNYNSKKNMPIVSVTYITSAPAIGCAAQSQVLPDATPVNGALDWSHSEVFVTPYESSLALESGRVADLTTVFTPASSCVDRWLIKPPPSCYAGDTVVGLDTVWSVNPTKSIVSDFAYSHCQLYGTATYSPGVCPSGQTIAEVIAYASSVLNGTKLFWQASCCKRFDTVAPYLSISV
jgi:hypothetical protein